MHRAPPLTASSQFGQGEKFLTQLLTFSPGTNPVRSHAVPMFMRRFCSAWLQNGIILAAAPGGDVDS